MIGRLRGNILEKQPPQVLIEVYGVGYEVYMPMTCFYSLPDINQEVIIFIQLVMREDAQLLFGFNNKHERMLFRELIKVNGVGPKLALAILSGMSAQQFIIAVESDNVEALIKLPGVGKKIAKRLVVEMRDRLKGMYSDLYCENTTFTLTMPESTLENNDAQVEAVAAMVSLGYKPQEATRMISKIVKPNADCETLIREALCAYI